MKRSGSRSTETQTHLGTGSGKYPLTFRGMNTIRTERESTHSPGNPLGRRRQQAMAALSRTPSQTVNPSAGRAHTPAGNRTEACGPGSFGSSDRGVQR